MRVYHKLTLAIVVTSLLALLLPALVADAQVVTFPDPNLEATIREAIGKPTGDISQSDLQWLTGLEARDRGIVSLAGLEYCTSLMSLELSDNQIGDVSPLANLTNLTWLGLLFNEIGDVSPLSNLTSLTGLELGSNPVNNISPLSSLTRLKYLGLSSSQISDISPLSNLTNLTQLQLVGNQIVDITALSSLTSLGDEHFVPLDTDLDLRGNKIVDISPLVENSGIGDGDIVHVRYNPLSVTSINVSIPQLEQRGVIVLWGAAPPPEPSPAEERSFTGSVPLPSEISTDPEVIGTNALYALILVLVLYFTATLFNSTIRENYEIIQGWLRRASTWLSFIGNSVGKWTTRLPGIGAKAGGYLEAVAMVAIFALLYSFLDPYFTHGLGGFALFISLALAIGIVTYGYEGTQVLLSTRRFRVPAGVKIFPIAIAVAAVFVIISRSIDFHPGLIYGFVGAYAALSAGRRLDKRQQAMAVLLGTGVLLVLIVAAFFLRIPIPEEARAGESFWLSVADGILVGVFVIGLEGLLFALVPLTFMDGAKVTAWRRWVWLAVFALVAFLFYHIIINEDGRLAEAAGDMEVVMMFWLMGLFAVLSGVAWIYFQWRRKLLPQEVTREQPPLLPEEGEGRGEPPPEEEEGKPTLMVPKEDEEWAEPVTEEDTENQTSVSPEEGEERDG